MLIISITNKQEHLIEPIKKILKEWEYQEKYRIIKNQPTFWLNINAKECKGMIDLGKKRRWLLRHLLLTIPELDLS